jgi:hypothetical protein
MIRRVALSRAQHRLALRASLALAGASIATGAFAQTVTQSLTINFTGGAPVPIGGWAAIGIALILAAAAGWVLRRSRATGVWIWFAAMVGTAGLFALPPIGDAHAAFPPTFLDLVTNPATVVFTFPGAPVQTEVTVTNKSGAPTTLLAITLAPGPYSTFAVGVPCTVGMVLPANGTCNIGLGES